MDRLMQFFAVNPSSRGASELEEALYILKQKTDKVDELYTELLDEDDDADRAVVYNERLDANADIRAQYVTAVLDLIEQVGKAPVPQPAAAPAYAGGGRPKICDALKPSTLTVENTPAEYRSWLNKYKAYYTTSRMDLYTVPEQHVFMYNVLSVDLETQITEHEDYDVQLPVFNDAGNSMADILTGVFHHRYPLFNRRLEFFRYTQSQGQGFTNYMANLRQKGDEADLHALGVDEMYVFRFLTGVCDTKLRERFLKLDNPNLEAMKQAARAYEVGKLAEEAMDERPGVSRVAKVDAARSTKKSGEYKPEKKKIPPELMGKCFRCGDPSHVVSACPMERKDCICTTCKKVGHLQIVCMQPYRNEDTDSVDKAFSVSALSIASSDTDSESD